MSNFKINEKVVCVKPKYELKPNEIYTVESIITCSCGLVTITVFELPILSSKYVGTKCYCGQVSKNNNWDASRFRKLDTQFGEDVITELNQQFNSTKRVLVHHEDFKQPINN